MECKLPHDPFLKTAAGKTWLFALITPCKTEGRDAAKEHTTYTTELASVIADLRSVQVVVGRVCSRGVWTLINRSDTFADTSFSGDNSDSEDEDYM